MHLQRDRRLRKVGTQVVKWTTEGAVKEDMESYDSLSILRREGIRQLPGICWYPVRAHSTKSLCEARWHRGKYRYSLYQFIPSLTEVLFCQGRFVFLRLRSKEEVYEDSADIRGV